MADPMRLIDYTVPPLTYVDPAHILLFGTSGGAGANVLASALVARQADGSFYADRSVAGPHRIVVRNNDASGAAQSQLVLQTGTLNSYAFMQVTNGSYRQIANGAALTTAFDDADNHNFRKSDGTSKLLLWSSLDALFPSIIWVNNNKLLIQHDGSNGYVRAETGSLILGTAAANRWIINPTAFFPASDNTYALGWSANRATVVYSATGAINTSDERAKRFRLGDALTEALTEAELRAARRIAAELRWWQWIEEIDRKGEDAARWHFGPSAQAVARILMDEGIEQAQDIDLPADQFLPEDQRPSFRTAFLCFDTWENVWEDEYEDVTTPHRVPVGERVSAVLGADGTPIREPVFEDQEQKSRRATGNKVLVTPAGNRFGLRVDQLALFLLAAQEQRLAALEAAA